MVHLATGSPPIGAGGGSERPEGHTHTHLLFAFQKAQTHRSFYQILGNSFPVMGLVVPTR